MTFKLALGYCSFSIVGSWEDYVRRDLHQSTVCLGGPRVMNQGNCSRYNPKINFWVIFVQIGYDLLFAGPRICVTIGSKMFAGAPCVMCDELMIGKLQYWIPSQEGSISQYLQAFTSHVLKLKQISSSPSSKQNSHTTHHPRFNPN